MTVVLDAIRDSNKVHKQSRHDFSYGAWEGGNGPPIRTACRSFPHLCWGISDKGSNYLESEGQKRDIASKNFSQLIFITVKRANVINIRVFLSIKRHLYVYYVYIYSIYFN